MKAALIGDHLAALGVSAAALAADDVRSARSAAVGQLRERRQAAVAAMELAADRGRAPPELNSLPLAAGAGLPNLGRRVGPIVADHQGNPSERPESDAGLMTREVAAMLGSDHPSFLSLQRRWPSATEFHSWSAIGGREHHRPRLQVDLQHDADRERLANNCMDFLTDLKKAGHPASTVAIVHENTDDGTSVAGTVQAAAKAHGIDVVADICYNANGADVSAQVLQLKQKNPDAIVFIAYTSDSILYMKTMKSLDYLPKFVIGDDSGFSDPAFISAVGNLAQGALNRSAWNIGAKDSTTWRINEMYKAKTGRDLDDTSGRDMQAAFTLMDAINRAGSTKPEAIRKALQATDLKPSQLMMGYRGVKFDSTGQNTLAATYLIQLIGKQYLAVWPAEAAQHPLIYPFKGWK